MNLEEKSVRYEIHLKNGKILVTYSSNAKMAPIPQEQAVEAGNFFCLPKLTVSKEDVVYIKHEVIT
ncbi:hypothetical protein [Oceanobacillus sp. FSL H7-0719]|uniref:hypothetical protein n=1 Tax=Oceanobacillus sp. FSL H7-0719 TaxID=2954507 RepID=UPI0032485DDA